MRSVFALAVITFKEGIRNRSLFGIILLALFLLGLNITVAGFFMRDIGKVSVDMNLTALSLAGFLLVFFVSINLMAKDIDKKTIQIVLSKPISRAQYILGKYFGLTSFIAISLAFLVVLSFLTLFFLKIIYSGYFSGFSWFIYTIACVSTIFRFFLLLAVVIFFSSITTSSLITLIFSISTFIAGTVIEEVVFYIRSELALQEKLISEGLKNFIDIISYVIPNFSFFDYSIEAAHGLSISIDRVLFSFGYGAVYISILLFLAIIVFSRREFH